MNWYKIAKFGDTVKQRYLAQGIDASVIDNYITKFDLIRKRKDKELFADIPNVSVLKNQRNDITAYKDFHDLERVVDYIKGQKQVDPTKSSESETPPIYQDNDLSIYRGTSPQECISIRGSYPYTWCIAALGSNNLYNTYRYKPNEPTFYFVKSNNIPVEDKYHFFVIQVDNENNYIVTSARNDGDKQMSWDQIAKINPVLANLQSIFKNIPLTPKERENYNKFRKGLNDNSFAQLSYEDKKMYLDTVGHQALSAGQFESLPDDLKSHYISFGLGLDYHKFKVVKDNAPLLKRYKQITERKVDAIKGLDALSISFKPSEFLILDENKKSEVINGINEYELNNVITSPGSTMDEADSLLKSIAKLKTKMSNYTVYGLLAYCNDINGMAQILGQENINKLTDRNVFNLLDANNDDNKMELAQILGQNNINKLSDNSVFNLLSHSPKESLQEKIDIVMSKGVNLSGGDIYYILKYAPNPNEIVEKILEYKGSSLSSPNISHIMENPKIDNSNDKLAKKIIQYKGNNLTGEDVFHLLSYAYNPKELVKLMGPNNINKLDSDLVYPLIVQKGGYRMIEMANLLGQENINKIRGNDIFHLLRLRNEEDRKAIQKIMIHHPEYAQQLEILKRRQPQTARSLEETTPVTASRLFSSKFNDNFIGNL